jgi:hypothetical protein
MRRYAFRLAVLALAVLGPSVVRADDQEIAQQIVQKLQAEKQAGNLKGFSIDLQVEDGTVWLSGRVANEVQQAKALDIARRVPGVTQVVNDLNVAEDATPTVRPAVASQEVFARMASAPIGSGVAGQPAPARVAVAQPIGQSAAPAPLPHTQGGYGYGYGGAAPTPVYAGSRSQVPLAYAPARTVGHEGVIEGAPAGPIPMYAPGSGVGMAPARYDHPNMPGYAWPSYAAHPNYAAVTYPKQYSPSAWPYIGPFYPYPQVPLGWRKVTLEWDDGWWMLDFKERRSMYNH